MTFNIPEFEYFDMGGRCSGNRRGTARDDFNFLFFKDGGRFTLRTWYGVRCFDLSDIVSQADFDPTREGYHAALDWVEEQVSLWRGEHTELARDMGYFTK